MLKSKKTLRLSGDTTHKTFTKSIKTSLFCLYLSQYFRMSTTFCKEFSVDFIRISRKLKRIVRDSLISSINVIRPPLRDILVSLR